MITRIDPLEVYFTHSKVRPCFSGCGKQLAETIEEVRSGLTGIDDIPMITVLRGTDGHMFSLNNRRLFVLKHLRSEGLLLTTSPSNTIQVRSK
jgi:hypothetical protein